ncbi:MAG TPA: TonB-dependent siderophore receptor [Bryobacteraceae bacterium]|nr:TonB-dependent siderophore receptor [Bryobacteraceae bacterium]
MRIKIKMPRKTDKRKNSNQSNWPVAYRWMTIGTLVAYSAIGTKTINVAHAQDVTHRAQAPSAVAQTQGSQPVRRFAIPPGQLDSVLADFEHITGYSVTVSQAGIRGVASPGVTGVYTAAQALQKLLAGTGLTYRFSSPNALSLDIQSVAISVDVTGRVDPLAASSPKFAQPLLDTPQTITSVPEVVMEQQGVTTLRDALRNVAGISLAAGEGGAQGDNLTIRGFTARNDLYIDGMRDFGSYYRDPFNTEEVEVLQGPSSVTFGRGSTGGVVNQATKTPGLTRFISGDADFGSDLTRRVAVDYNQPLQKLGSGAAFRLNVMGDEGNVAGRDIAENRRFGIAPSLALGLGSPTRWTFSYFHQNADDIPDYGLPWLFNGPAPVPRNNYYGFKDGNYLRTYDDIGTFKVEHDVNSHISLRNQARFANYVRDVLITEPQVPKTVTLDTPLDQIDVTRHEIGVNSTESLLDEQLDLTANFETGVIRHSLVSGIEAGRETSNPTRPTWTNVPDADLLNPDPYQPLSGDATITSRVRTTAVTTAAYALDTLRFGKHWDLTGGIRWDRFDTNYAQTVGAVASYHRVDEMPSWRAAVVYKPVSFGSIYFDAGTSFNPSAESLSLSASTASLPPEKNRTYEFGSKWEMARNRLSLRAALFRTEKLNAREPDPNNTLLNVLAGTQRVNGAQIDVRARLTDRWNLLASYADLDGTLISSNYYPAAIGAPLANVPRHTFNFWSTQQLPWRWETGIGTNFVSSRTASSTAPFDPVTGLLKEVPGYWTFSAMAKHRLAEHVDLQVNINNITNRYYYDELHPAHIVLGPGRSALAGLKFKF